MDLQQKKVILRKCWGQGSKNKKNISESVHPNEKKKEYKKSIKSIYIFIRRIYVNPIKKNITDIWKYVFMNSDHVLKGNEIFFGFFWLCFSLSSYLNMKRYMYNNKENGFIIHPPSSLIHNQITYLLLEDSFSIFLHLLKL